MFSINDIDCVRNLSLDMADSPEGMTVQRGMASERAYAELLNWGYVERISDDGKYVCYRTTDLGRSISKSHTGTGTLQ